ncbi:MAG: hypothetical protein LBU70_08030 [Chitinispirillales bacterium]|nr:hypothetical protein [Chitinispirillales bacterium]
MPTKIPRLRRLAYVFAIIAAMLMIPAAAHAANRGRVVDVAGQTHEATSLRLMRGRKLSVVCGDARISVPFRAIRSMKIDPAQISPVDGRPHLGIEIQMQKTGTVIGDILERGRCLVGADNGLRWKVSKKANFSAPFSGLFSVEIIGKKDEIQADGDDDGDDDD